MDAVTITIGTAHRAMMTTTEEEVIETETEIGIEIEIETGMIRGGMIDVSGPEIEIGMVVETGSLMIDEGNVGGTKGRLVATERRWVCLLHHL